MKKFIKILLIVGVVFILVGGIIFTVAMCVDGWDFSKLSNRVVEQKTLEIVDEVDSVTRVKVIADTADVNILYHDEQQITVDCYDIKSDKGELLRQVTATIDGNELEIKDQTVKNQLFSIGFENTRITVKLPRAKVVSLKVEVSTGDVKIGEKGEVYTFNNLNLNTSTGQIKLDGDLNCNELFVTTSTGKVCVNGKLNLIKMEVEGSTSDLIINATVIASEIEVDHSTGDVVCNAFITAEKINVETSTGDVTLRLLGVQSDYTYTYDIDTGKSNIFPTYGGSKQVNVETSTGDAYIYFELQLHS